MKNKPECTDFLDMDFSIEGEQGYVGGLSIRRIKLTDYPYLAIKYNIPNLVKKYSKDEIKALEDKMKKEGKL